MIALQTHSPWNAKENRCEACGLTEAAIVAGDLRCQRIDDYIERATRLMASPDGRALRRVPVAHVDHWLRLGAQVVRPELTVRVEGPAPKAGWLVALWRQLMGIRILTRPPEPCLTWPEWTVNVLLPALFS